MCTIRNVWQSATDDDRERLRQFYRKEEAFANEMAMESRLSEILIIVEDAGQIIGISRAFSTTPPQILQPLYYLSVFIGKGNRGGVMLTTLLRQSTKILEEYARPLAFPCIGILLELFSEYFYQKPNTWRRKGVWQGSQFHFIGKSIRGYDLRVHYFRDAYLKDVGDGNA